MQTKLNPAGWVRLVLYVISALVGVGAVVATTLGYDSIAARWAPWLVPALR